MDFPLLSKYGMPCVPYAFAKNAKQAQAAAEKIGYPVALKLSSAKALHKTEKGAVILNICDEKGLLSSVQRLLSIDSSGMLLVQKMVKPKFELIIGGKIDAQFGPIVLVGSGGIYVEVFKDKSLRACPVSMEDALEMIRELKAYPVLAGARGGKVADENELARIIVSASKLMMDEKVSELDINPLVWDGVHFLAADARVIR